MAPGLPAASTAPQGQPKSWLGQKMQPLFLAAKAQKDMMKNDLSNAWEKNKYELPFLGRLLKKKDTGSNFLGGIARIGGFGGTEDERADKLFEWSQRFRDKPWEALGGVFKSLYNNNPKLEGGGGLLLGGLALNSLLGKKKERQYGPPQGGGQNININLGGGAAPGMFGYHRAGVSSLGAPTGLTSNYGMDNKFGMDMVKHAGAVSTALGNVVKNRIANQAVDTLMNVKPESDRSHTEEQKKIELAVKDPEVLKLLENEQNQAYLNRLLSEK